MTAQPPGHLIEAARSALVDIDLRPIVLWPNDLGGTATVFLSSLDGTCGVQLDLLHDPRALGKYGVKADRLFERTVEEGGWPVLDDDAEVTYLLAKRIIKRDSVQLSALDRRVAAIGRSPIAATAHSVLNSRLEGLERRHLVGGHGLPTLGAQRVPNLARLGKRIRQPKGFGSISLTPTLVPPMNSRPGIVRFFLQTKAGEANGWIWVEVWPVLVRAGLFVSWGGLSQASPIRPHLVTFESSINCVANQLIETMSKRLRARLKRI